MKEWYFCVAVAGLLLSSCSQQVQERADGGKTSDTIITEVPVEETCDSTGYRLYRKYLAAIGENPSYFQWKDFPKYLGAAYVDEKGHFVIQVLGDSAKARKQIVEAVGSDEVTVIPRRNSRQLLDSLYAYLCEIRRFRADEPTVAVFDTVCYDAVTVGRFMYMSKLSIIPCPNMSIACTGISGSSEKKFYFLDGCR